jgi:hypothetical protein
LRARVAEELQQELDAITDHVDKVVRDVRDYAFLQRTGGPDKPR